MINAMAAVLAVVATGLVLLAVFVLPSKLVSDERIENRRGDRLKQEDVRLKALNDARVTGLQALGVVALIVGSVLTWRTVRLTREGQITDRYAKAVENLDPSKSNAVQLAAITALDRIARDSRRDHWPIVELLVEHLRGAAPPHDPDNPAQGPATVKPIVKHIAGVLARRRTGWDERDRSLSLQGLDLRSVDLKGADLRRANLSGSNLSGAFMAGAKLDGAHLLRTTARGADLTRATLTEARLRGADFRDAILREADFSNATFEMTKLTGADRQGARGLSKRSN
jgi:hypothetical protein